jgi:hypothetical protein
MTQVDYRNVLPGSVEYPFPLREGGNTYLILPRDLSLTEAHRLAAFLESLVAVADPSPRQDQK